MKSNTLASLLEKYPPFLVYGLAKVRREPMSREQRSARYSWGQKQWRERQKRLGRVVSHHTGWRCLTQREIAERSGLSERKVKRIVRQLSWRDVKVGDALALMKGCGFELTRLQRVNAYLRNSFQHRHMWSAMSNRRFAHFAKMAAELESKRKAVV